MKELASMGRGNIIKRYPDKMNHPFKLVGLLLCGVFWVMMAADSISAQVTPKERESFVFTKDSAIAAIIGHGVSGDDVEHVFKLPTDNGVYAIYLVGDKRWCALIDLKASKVIKTLPCPGYCGFLNKKYQFVAWTHDFAHEMEFPDYKVVLNQHDNVPFTNNYEECRFDNAGEYFALQNPDKISLFPVSDPSGKPLLVFRHKWIAKLASSDDSIYLFLRNGVDDSCECVIAPKSNPSHFRSITIPKVNILYDLNEKGTQLIFGRDLFHSAGGPPYNYYLFDLTTQKENPLSRLPGNDYGFFAR